MVVATNSVGKSKQYRVDMVCLRLLLIAHCTHDAGMGYYTEGVGADDHYSTPDYNSHDGGSGSAAPPMFTNTGFGAINQFVTAPGSDHSSRSMSNPPTGYTFAGNQQV